MLKKENLILLLLFLTYLFFSTNNSTIDSFYYAFQIKNNLGLYHPHHLLYNATGYYLYEVFSYITGYTPDVLKFMKGVNALSGVFCLIVLRQILKLIKTSENLRASLLLLTGSSFAVMRFATENETYILPILFSLSATFYFIKYQQESNLKYLLFSSILASIACLFHQIHFFWWLGILISLFFITSKSQKWQGLFLYTLPSLIMPVSYILVVKFNLQQELTLSNIIHFTFREFYLGNTETDFSVMHIILTVANSIRTWVQVHGNLISIFNHNYFIVFLGAVAFVITVTGLVKSLRKKPEVRERKLFLQVLVILLLQLAFAFYAVGNAEFMVMIPFLAAILLACLTPLPWKPVFLTSLGLFIWNLSVAIYPSSYYELTGYTAYRNYIIDNPDKLFVVKNKPQIESEIEYITGKTPSNLVPSPEYCILKYGSTELIQKKIDSAHNKNVAVMTDCIGNNHFLSRARILSLNKSKTFFEKYPTHLIDSLSFTLNKSYIYQVSQK